MATANRTPVGGARRRAREIDLVAAGTVLLCIAAVAGRTTRANALPPAQAASTACAPRASLALGTGDGGLVQRRTLAGVSRLRHAYSWPLKPFERQHPVRAFFNDPRIGDGAQHQHAFHFGIDISAPDRTPVYAVEAGKVFIQGGEAVAVLATDGSHSFGYWHINRVVTSHQYVQRHQLLGYVGSGWEHVHFAERRNGQYVNPLRPGALGPYVDRKAPTIAEVAFSTASPGRTNVVVNAFDTPDPKVPGVWRGKPVTPALLQWRIPGVTNWRTAVDFRSTMLPLSRYTSVYAPATRQNHKTEPGLFCFYVRRGWNPSALGDGTHRLQIAATDTYGNRAVATVSFAIAQGRIA